MGVNRKACNAGIWGDSGRYPLIYECINLTLKYTRRLQNLNDNSLVSLAFKEQMNLNLPWYKNLQSILSLDPCFSADHVTAFQLQNQKHTNLTIANQPSPAKPLKENFLIHNGFKKRIPLQTAKPIGSKRFTPHIVLKSLKTVFKESWSSYVKSSSKLEFYRDVKSHFEKESYLDQITKYTDRANITRLRISAHRLEIETGRYNNTPRDDRICSWCNTVLGTRIIENEWHLLHECDLNAVHRRKCIEKINSIIVNSNTDGTMTSTSTPTQYITQNTNLISIISKNNEISSSLPNGSQVHLTRIIARFTTKCFNNREKFIDSLSSSILRPNK